RALWNEARARRFSHRMGQRIDSLAALTEAARMRPEEGLRDDAIAVMALPDLRLGQSWEAENTQLVLAGFDRRYRFCVEVEPRGLLVIRTVPERTEIRAIHSGHDTRSLFLSDDGDFL